MRGRKLNRKLRYVVAMIMCIAVVNMGDVIVSMAEENDLVVEYHGCTSNGWNQWVKQGEECKVDAQEGLTRLELKLKKENGDTVNSNIEYSVYSEKGWSIPVNGGDMASAAGKPLKAIQVNVKGDVANLYKVEYRVCNTKGEWYAWGNNGAVVGDTTGDTIISAVQIKMVKNQTEASQTENTQEIQTPVQTQKPTDGSPSDASVNIIETPQVPLESNVSNTLPNGAPGPTSQPGATEEPEIINYPPTEAPTYSDEDTGTNNTSSEQVTTPVEETIAADVPVTTEKPVTNDTSTVTTGDPTMEAFVAKVASQIGQGRNSAGNTIYGEWWAQRVNNSAFESAKWCAMFLSWCANQAGVAEETIGYYAACSFWEEGFKSKSRWSDRSGYTPKRGDLIFFNTDSDPEADHNGLVESVSESQVVAIEGNVNDVVARVTYDINDGTILGYGKPDYANNAANLEKQKQKEKEEETASVATGALVDRLLQVAYDEIGNREGSGGWTKYGEWYGKNIAKSGGFSCAAWCAMFVTYCANKSGVPTSVIEPYAYCPTGVNNFKNKGQYQKKSGYTPKKGDIIFFNRSNRPDHTGIVSYVKDGQVYTVEGNTSNAVKEKHYPLSDPGIIGYATPNY